MLVQKMHASGIDRPAPLLMIEQSLAAFPSRLDQGGQRHDYLLCCVKPGSVSLLGCSHSIPIDEVGFRSRYF